jgi:hypothetical protein
MEMEVEVENEVEMEVRMLCDMEVHEEAVLWGIMSGPALLDQKRRGRGRWMKGFD